MTYSSTWAPNLGRGCHVISLSGSYIPISNPEQKNLQARVTVYELTNV